MPNVIITPESLFHSAGPWVKILEEAGLTVIYPEDSAFTRSNCSTAETIRVLSPASAVIAGGESFAADVLAGLPQMRVIARAGVGYDRVDVPEATSRKIAVTITPTANHEGVAEQVFALIFALAKKVVLNDANTRSGRWFTGLTTPIRGKTLGLFGLGRIGRSTALRGIAMGMRVIATEMHPDQDFVSRNHIELVDFDKLLAESDYLSLHCPHNAQTERMFNRNIFAKMKKGSALINTARGRIVAESDLAEALQSGHLGGAGLDVFEVEPAKADNPLFQFPNVVLSPHLGGGDQMSQDNMAIEAAQCIAKLYQGQWPEGAVVNPQLQANWSW